MTGVTLNQKALTEEQMKYALTRVMPTADPIFHHAMEEVMYNHLMVNGNDLGEEDPVLLVEFLPELLNINLLNAPPTEQRRAAVTAALSAVADDISGGLGICFRFKSHGQLRLAKDALSNGNSPGNIAWAFFPGPGARSAGLGDSPRCINTRLITFYSHKSGKLTDDYFEFFEY